MHFSLFDVAEGGLNNLGFSGVVGDRFSLRDTLKRQSDKRALEFHYYQELRKG